MTLEAFARRILSRKHGYFHRAWLKGTHRVEVLPEEQGKPRKVRLVPIH